MLLRTWRFVTLYLTALTLSLTFCHLLQMPRKMCYDDALYITVQHSLYLYFAYVGALTEVGAVVFLIVLSIALRRRGAVFYLTLTATICVAAGRAVWFAAVSPANAQMAQWHVLPLPANWTDVRRQREFGHAASAILDLIGFGALLLSVIVDTPKSTG
jgi:hypothetical protein